MENAWAWIGIVAVTVILIGGIVLFDGGGLYVYFVS